MKTQANDQNLDSKKAELHNWVRNGHLGFLACLSESSRSNLTKQCKESDRRKAHQSQQIWHDLNDKIYHSESKAQCERETDRLDLHAHSIRAKITIEEVIYLEHNLAVEEERQSSIAPTAIEILHLTFSHQLNHLDCRTTYGKFRYSTLKVRFLYFLSNF